MPTHDPMLEPVIDLCRHLCDRPEASLTLSSMASRVGVSPSHLQRRFKALVGVSPREFHEAQRLRLFKHGLRGGDDVTEALHRAGYSSPSRMHERVRRDLGMRPTQYRRGGEGIEIHHAQHDTPLGPVLLAATERGLCFLQFGSPARLLRELAQEFPRAQLQPMPTQGEPVLRAWMEPLLEHLAGEPRQLELPLDLQGTAFELTVWRYLQQIPAGETRSYQDVARSLDRPGAARAVGRACSRNRIAVLVPCHRVLRADGSLGGYRWGLSRKRALLAAEAGGQRPDPARA